VHKEASNIVIGQDHQSGAAIRQQAEHDQQGTAAPPGEGGYEPDSRV
jgi:hypothetical protein